MTLLSVDELTVRYGSFCAVDTVSFAVEPGTTLAIVGESGSGKSTIAAAIVRLVRPASGRIVLDGTDIATLPEKRLRPLRHKIQMIFQDPYGSLDPHQTAQEIVAEPLRLRGRDRSTRAKKAKALLDRVGLPASAYDRRPAEFSGGQRQRIGIARALASEPELLVCDEATSALDVSVQAQVLDLLREIQRDTGVAYVFISHNLAVVKEISNEVLVLRDGKVVETGPTDQVLTNPAEPYTRELRRAALDPTTIKGRKPRALLAGGKL
jgi:ABC-type glutathione transport system ATPase component